MKKQASSKATEVPFKQAHELGWKDFDPGFVLTEAGSSVRYRTGDWRSKRPYRDNSRCIKCGLCYIFCPDMAVTRRADGFFEADLEYCKGCGICAVECQTQCIKMKDER